MFYYCHLFFCLALVYHLINDNSFLKGVFEKRLFWRLAAEFQFGFGCVAHFDLWTFEQR
jgi:hypothetical protein